MDDPWANAWGEPAKPTSTTWSQKIHDDDQEPEADIATPSWTTGGGIQWAEPQVGQTTLWQPASPKEWATSPYEDIKLGNPPATDHFQITGREVLETNSDPSPVLNRAVPRSATPEEGAIDLRATSPTLASPTNSEPGSPDAFGTFETGLDAGVTSVDPWSESGVATNVESTESVKSDPWTTPWGSGTEKTTEEHGQQVDEWEAAKRQKEKQDQHVPPHVLASILHGFSALSNELWPETPSTSSSTNDYLEHRHGGITEVEGLVAVIDRIVPHNLTLPPYVHFSKTFTAKHMMDALRLSRNVAVSLKSPFTLYMASKGSAAWETSVKSTSETSKDELLPPGWRVVEKQKEEPLPTVDSKKRTGGGLLSFFGRRGNISPSTTDSARSSSPPHQVSLSTASAVSPAQVQSSVDSPKSLPSLSSTPTAMSTQATPAPTVLPDHDEALSTSWPQADALDPPAPAQSAVSRFLTRFSRGTSSGSSPHNSLALSTDDIEFLSDIVPSVNDDVDEASQLQALSHSIGSSALGQTAKLPAPLPPPPRLTTPSVSSSNQSSLSQTVSNNGEDFMSFFDSPSRTTTPIPKTSSHNGYFMPAAPTTPRVEPQSTDSSTPSRKPSSLSFEPQPSLSRTHTPINTRRTPTAIMTPGSSRKDSQSIFALPPPPTLPPPPSYRNSPSEFASTSQPPSRPPSRFAASESRSREVVDEDLVSDLYSSPVPPLPRLLQQRPRAPSSLSSDFSDNSLLSHRSKPSLGRNDFFDDFDDFISSPLQDPSPPRPPAKPTLLGNKPLPPPLLRGSPPRNPYQVADQQLIARAGTQPDRRPTPQATPPLRAPLPSYLGTSAPDSGSAAAKEQVDVMPALTSSLLPSAPFPKPPSLHSIPTTIPLVPPLLSKVSSQETSQILHNNGIPRPASGFGTNAARPNTTSAQGLSAQDLSFFEGL